MPWIDETWLQDALAALKATCDVDAHTRNAMIQFLLDNGFWDQEKLKDWASALRRAISCLIRVWQAGSLSGWQLVMYACWAVISASNHFTVAS